METDKEFDELFHSKLDNFEAVPSAGVWAAIAGELHTGKPKRLWVSLLSIAASIVVLLSAALLFIPHQTKPTRKPLVQNKIIKVKQGLNTPVIAKNTGKQSIKPKAEKKEPLQSIANNSIKRYHLSEHETVKNNHGKFIQSDLTEPAGLTASVQQKKPELTAPAAAVQELKMPDEHHVIEKISEKPILAAVPPPVINHPVTEEVKPKHKIKSFGDLVNVVMARVDKRKDKLIEFTDTDDDQSNITGINLGILKIKKEK